MLIDDLIKSLSECFGFHSGVFIVGDRRLVGFGTPYFGRSVTRSEASDLLSEEVCFLRNCFKRYFAVKGLPFNCSDKYYFDCFILIAFQYGFDFIIRNYEHLVITACLLIESEEYDALVDVVDPLIYRIKFEHNITISHHVLQSDNNSK